MSSVLDPVASYMKNEVKSCTAPVTKPRPESHDSAEEFSLARLVRIRELLEIEDRELEHCVFDDSLLHVA
jgi:hypothetical protein